MDEDTLKKFNNKHNKCKKGTDIYINLPRLFEKISAKSKVSEKELADRLKKLSNGEILELIFIHVKNGQCEKASFLANYLKQVRKVD